MPTFPDTRLRKAGISATRTAQLLTAYNAMDAWQQQRFRGIVASAPDEILRRTYDPAGVPDPTVAPLTPAQVAGDPAVLASVQAAILAAHDSDAERETFTPARLADAALKAAYGPRPMSVAYAATITPNVDTTGVLTIGALAGNLTLANPAGTPVDGQNLRVRLAQDATGSRAVTFGAAYAFGTDVTAALIPSAASAAWEMLFTWHAGTSKWRATAIVRGF